MKVCVFLFIFCTWAAVTIQAQTTDSMPTTARVIFLHVISEIQSRFAITDVLSEVENVADVAKELTFTTRLPDAAFISNFSMEINGVVTYGEVKEKAEAKATFERAKSRGLTAGHVAERARETNVFTVSVNVEAKGKAKFNLTFQEVLKRVHGVYKHVLNIQADQQDVKQIQIDVLIAEREKIKTLRVPKFGAKIGEKTNKELLKSPEEVGVTKRISNGPHGSIGFVSYSLPESSLKSGGKQLAVLYDVDRQNDGGAIEVINGYFVHFFAPSGIPPGDKNVIFVLDKSGSMTGHKFFQLQQAMSTILDDLHPSDSFNVIMFNDLNDIWRRASVQATKENVKSADAWVQKQEAGGGTKLHAAISEATRLLLQDSRASSAPLTSTIIYLTDGRASVDVEKLTQANRLRFSMHGVAFGEGADLRLLRRISSANNGLTRKVYEHADAPLQLTGFYQEISTPLLRDVKVKYVNESVDVSSLVGNAGETGGIYYSGSELVTVGRVKKDGAKVVAEVSGRSTSTKPFLKKTASTNPPPARRGVPLHTSPSIRCHPVAVGPGRLAFSDRDLLDLRRFRHIPLCEDFSKPLINKPLLDSATVGGFVERMWAYMTTKKYLKEADLADDDTTRAALTKKALDISLKYSFVTKLTSMVVVPPGQEARNKTAVSGDVDEEKAEGADRSFSLPGGVPAGPRGCGGGGGRCRSGSQFGRRRPRRPSGRGGPIGTPPTFMPFTSTRRKFGPTRTPPTTTTTIFCDMHVVFIVDQRLKAGAKTAIGNAVMKLASHVKNRYTNLRFSVYQQYRNNASLKEIGKATTPTGVMSALFGVGGTYRPVSYLVWELSPGKVNIIVHAIAGPMPKWYIAKARLLRSRATYLVMTPKRVEPHIGFTPDAFVDMTIPETEYESYFPC